MSTDKEEELRRHVDEIRSRGPWIPTSSGSAWSIRDPRPEDVRIEDIIGGLARTCRWSGQLREDIEMYSVAEHSSVMTVFAVESGVAKTREDAIAFLMHDAPEAPYFDAATPVKAEIPGINQFEARTDAAIKVAFDITPDLVGVTKADIKTIDRRICIDERQQVIAEPAGEMDHEEARERFPELEPLGVRLKCFNPHAAMQDFAETLFWVIETMPRAATGPDPVLEQALRIAPKYLPYRDLVPYAEPEEMTPEM